MQINDVPDWLVIDAVRYAVGRRSVQPTITADWLVANWRQLTPAVRDTVRRDLEGEFRDDDRLRADPRGERTYYPLGDDCDRAAWERVRALWQSPAQQGEHFHAT